MTPISHREMLLHFASIAGRKSPNSSSSPSSKPCRPIARWRPRVIVGFRKVCAATSLRGILPPQAFVVLELEEKNPNRREIASAEVSL
jgi:hypothetical protein